MTTFMDGSNELYDMTSIQQLVFYRFKEFVVDFCKTYGTKIYDKQSTTLGNIVQAFMQFYTNLLHLSDMQIVPVQRALGDLVNFVNMPIEHFLGEYVDLIDRNFDTDEQVNLLKFLDLLHAQVGIQQFNHLSRRLVDFRFNVLTEEQYRRYNNLASSANTIHLNTPEKHYCFENKRFFNIVSPFMLKNFDRLELLGRVKLDNNYLNILENDDDDPYENYSINERNRRREGAAFTLDGYPQQQDSLSDETLQAATFVLYYTKLSLYFEQFVGHLDHVCRLQTRNYNKICRDISADISTTAIANVSDDESPFENADDVASLSSGNGDSYVGSGLRVQLLPTQSTKRKRPSTPRQTTSNKRSLTTMPLDMYSSMCPPSPTLSTASSSFGRRAFQIRL